MPWRYNGERRPDFARVPQAGQESVWDYPRPPRIETVTRQVRVQYAGRLVAESTRCLRVCETASAPAYYLPNEDIVQRLVLEPGSSTVCEWKGLAVHWTVLVATEAVRRAAWSYPRPSGDYGALRDYTAFYPALIECFVDGVAALPQPGGYYGGWVTPEITGPVKGEPGTEDW